MRTNMLPDMTATDIGDCEYIFCCIAGEETSTHSISVDARPTPSNEDLDMSIPEWSDVTEIYGFYNNEDNDGGNGCYGRLNDGRYFSASQSTDYTFSNASIYFANTLADIEYYGLSDWERTHMEIDLRDHFTPA